MPQIGSRVFVAGGTKQYCSLLNDELVRYIGSDWTSLRIGLLVAMQENGVSSVSGRLGIGVCSGNTNPLGAASTTLFCGTRSLSPSTWAFNANAGNPYFSSGVQYGLRRVGNTDTTAGLSVTNLFIASNGGSLQRRSLVYVDVSKAGTELPQYTASAQMANDNTFTNFLEGLEYAGSTLTIQNVALTSSTQQGITFDQTPGLLDHVDVQWTGAAQALEIYAWGVWRRS